MNLSDLINPYVGIMKLRRFLYRKGILKSESVSIPVISVGNLSMGGTGKTPITIALAKYCLETANRKPAIVLRGYKRRSTGFLLVSDGNDILEDVTKSGDEAQLYAQELPEAIVICDEDRLRGAQNACKLGAEVILLDDGFQHLRIKRDLNILLINSAEGIPPVLPFGKGRESLSAMSDADIIIETNYLPDQNRRIDFGIKPFLRSRITISNIDFYTSHTEIDVMPDVLQGRKILALSGIANPEHFEKSLSGVGSEIIPYRLADHAEYEMTLLKRIVLRAVEENCDYIATTTKDAVKMLNNFRMMQEQDDTLPALAVIHSRIEFFHGKELLYNKINDLFKIYS